MDKQAIQFEKDKLETWGDRSGPEAAEQARALHALRVLYACSARLLPISSAHALHTQHALHIDLCARALQRLNVKKIEARIEEQVKRLAKVQKAKGCGAEDAAATSTLEPIELPKHISTRASLTLHAIHTCGRSTCAPMKGSSTRLA